MNFPLIYTVWAITAPVLLWLGWRATRESNSIHTRIILRSLVAAVACGFSGIGSSGVLVPAWALMTPRVNFAGFFAILVWWVLISIGYYFLYYFALKFNGDFGE